MEEQLNCQDKEENPKENKLGTEKMGNVWTGPDRTLSFGSVPGRGKASESTCKRSFPGKKARMAEDFCSAVLLDRLLQWGNPSFNDRGLLFSK